MICVDWKELLDRTGSFSVENGTLKACLDKVENVRTLECKALDKERILFVLDGECDVIWRFGKYRLTAGGWIGIPAGEAYEVHVFRSTVPCRIVTVQSDNDCKCFSSCNVYDMPEWEGIVWFGQECRGMTGRLSSADACVPDTAIVFPVERNGVQHQIAFVPGQDGLGYADWLRREYGMLWENGIRMSE